MDRLFLDANVLFSAAYREGAGLRRLWELRGVELLTSAYAFEEARRNLDTDTQRDCLEELARALEMVPESDVPIPNELQLAPKDEPILQAAVAAAASHLITGDRRDFGRYFGKRLEGVTIMTPRMYLETKGG